MSLCALIDDAETVWHHGIDMYSYRDGILKRLLNSAVLLAGPDAQMTLPATHDSGLTPLLSDAAWLNHEVGVAYEYGYRRYRDPQYLPIIRNEQKGLSMTAHQGPTSVLYDLDPAAAGKAPPRPLAEREFHGHRVRYSADHRQGRAEQPAPGIRSTARTVIRRSWPSTSTA